MHYFYIMQNNNNITAAAATEQHTELEVKRLKSWKFYLMNCGYATNRTWITREGLYAEIDIEKTELKKIILDDFTQMMPGNVVRLSFNDLDNGLILKSRTIFD